MSGLCMSCEYWNEGYVLDKKGWGLCDLTVVDDEDIEHPESLALSFPAADIRNALETAHNFGCIQFKQFVADDAEELTP